MLKFKGLLRQKYWLPKQIENKFFMKEALSAIKVSERVAEGLSKGLPVVALESTLITHGLPYPHNLKTALKMEEIVRENKAVPATIGIIDGRIHVGLSSDGINKLSTENEKCIKVSRRDLPLAISKGLNGGTTVAGTMVIAHAVGIPIFATGGIGGVHRGAESSFDISADLYELSQTPMTVVSAGVKSILDIGRTLEYLETLGVCVATVGGTRDFPAFFTPHSGFAAACSLACAQEAAALIAARDELCLKSGILLAVPIPAEFAEDGQRAQAVIEEALRQASERGVSGKEVTPFVLQRVAELSGGASLAANIGLLENNARVASQVAVHLCERRHQNSAPTSPRVRFAPLTPRAKQAFSPRPVCSFPLNSRNTDNEK